MAQKSLCLAETNNLSRQKKMGQLFRCGGVARPNNRTYSLAIVAVQLLSSENLQLGISAKFFMQSLVKQQGLCFIKVTAVSLYQQVGHFSAIPA
ncbi:hypothetical protein [Microvirga arabica]|uniref:hypothetical protein n=1 Tax=Microvirga arabica TaxID=1128671 RepID=UPI00193A93FC|nr:hypothetical protein [Microvirga arabica]MBM1174464.1 hypothetical protein [Microvirga arabica]